MVVAVRQVQVEALPPDRLQALIGPERAERFRETTAAARASLGRRRVINVNSTARGGGVAELLESLLPYARGVGIDASWLVIDGGPEFFEITKRLHNRIYGVRGDAGSLGGAQRAAYEETLRSNRADLLDLIRPGDIVVLHDPQAAGLTDAARRAGAIVIWRCHIGRDAPNAYSDEGWDFLRPYVEDADAYVFSRAAFIPRWADRTRTATIPPSIDPFSAKNRALDPATTLAILQFAGLLAAAADPPALAVPRPDGSPVRLDRRADTLATGPAPPADAPLVVQVSRWDRTKDMPGVMHGFVEHLDGHREAHLALVGPAVDGVEDDPESGAVLDECLGFWGQLSPGARRRVHLACLPLDDPDQQATIVNALQRHAAVVTQKSLVEGFGLTVTEALWKQRPVVASRVGGIGDQIRDHEQGLLLDDPADLTAFGAAVRLLLDDHSLATRLAEAGHQRARAEFLPDRHLERYAALFATLAEP
ncbi:MAG TPA: glycosyltransferase [Acidimicrobiia bacterium]|nr:glycosyltransferase [Acidimicrobiia bacterium]